MRTIKSAQGTERVTANIVKGLADRGHEVDFLIEDTRGWLVDKLDMHPRINIIHLGNDHVSAIAHRGLQMRIIFGNLLSSPLALIGLGDNCTVRLLRLMGHNNAPVLALVRYINTHRPAAVMSFLNYPNLVLLLAAAFVKTQTRIIVNVRNHISTSAKYGKSRWMRSMPRLIRRFFPAADLIVAPSHGVAEDVREITGLSPDLFRVIVNPVYRPEIEQLADEDPGHPWLCEDVPVIIAAGKLKLQKDFRTLLLAFASIRKNRRVRLIILGEGPLRTELTELAQELDISDDFQLPGHVKNPYAYFRRASVFVLSSAWEGLPNVLIEAMACGCPVVSTDCPSGPSEILDEGRVGRLVPVGDAVKLAEAVTETLDSPADPEVVIRRARHYSFDRVISDYENLLSNAHSTAGNRG